MQFDKQFIRENRYIRLGIFVLFLAIVATLFPRNRISVLSYEIGASWLQPDVIAPFTFPIYKENGEYEGEKDDAVRRILPVFRRTPDKIPPDLSAPEGSPQGREVSTPQGRESRPVIAESEKLFNRLNDVLAAELAVSLSDTTRPVPPFDLVFTPPEKALLLAEYRRGIVGRGAPTFLTELRKMLPSLILPLLADGILDVPKASIGSPQFVIRSQNDREEIVFSTAGFRDSLEARLTLEELLTARLAKRGAVSGSPDSLRFTSPALLNDSIRIALKLSEPLLVPNILYDSGETRVAEVRAVQGVAIADGVVKENEKVISRGEKITLLAKRKLDSFLRVKAERETETGDLRLYIGKILLIIIISALFVIYLYLFRENVFYDNIMLALIALIVLAELFATWYSLRFEELSPYVIPIALASLLLTIIFDSRIGILGTITLSLLAATIRGNDFSYALASIFSGGLGVFTIRSMRQRSQLFISVFVVYLGYALSILAFSFARLSTWGELLDDLKFAGFGTLSCFLVYPILLVIERVFGITTELTLLELSDINHPLLKQMALEAPGTYHHTLQVSLLSEQAAEAISANALLCRVGAYFHDIGKMASASYFTENQTAPSPHDALASVMSGRVIASHVIDGIKLGRAKRIPEKILDFIPQHHGTTMIHFFYDKAVKELPPEKLNADDFRYPGPKPQSREAAIVMLADGVEASCRSLTEPNEETISKMIDLIIRKRLVDEDQFSECPITIAEVQLIKQSFITTLTASRHKRIKYPGQKL